MEDLDTRDVATTAPPATSDRRRPGRPETVSPALIPLLRGQDAPFVDAADQHDADGQAGLRGIVWGLVLSAPIWAVIIAGVRHLTR